MFDSKKVVIDFHCIVKSKKKVINCQRVFDSKKVVIDWIAAVCLIVRKSSLIEWLLYA